MPDVAVVGYKLTERFSVDGNPVTLEAADASTRVKGSSGWWCVLHAESVIGDPLGREGNSITYGTKNPHRECSTGDEIASSLAAAAEPYAKM